MSRTRKHVWAGKYRRGLYEETPAGTVIVKADRVGLTRDHYFTHVNHTACCCFKRPFRHATARRQQRDTFRVLAVGGISPENVVLSRHKWYESKK